MQLKDKIVLVSGGSGLLGSEILKLLRSRGAIAFNLDIDIETNLDEFNVRCDITKEEDLSNVYDVIYSNFGKIDGLVNNAYPRTKDWGADFENTSTDSWRTNVDWQLNSYVFLTQKLIPLLKKNGSGSVINMTSIYGVVGNDFSIYEGTKIKTAPAYSAIKGGLINLTRYLASAYGRQNIRFNCVSPGGIFDHQDEKFVRAYESKVPLKRMGNPDDIAPVVSFLLSDDSKYITGQNIIVDGGWTSI
jgi:NAD(P)-dependent dehydrogenase (short-subunit alcohol dehydrogenase family)